MQATKLAVLSSDQALLELSMRNAEQSDSAFEDVVIEGIRAGLPPEVLTRLQALWNETRVIAGEVVAIGRIIANEIMAFLQANPGVAIGLAIGAAVGVLISAVPVIGPLLAPIAAVLTGLYAAGVGATAQGGKNASGSPLAVITELARKFFELFVAIMAAVTKYWEAR